MNHRKAVNNEILDIMIKYALIERYTEEVNSLRQEVDDISLSEAFERKMEKFAHLAGRNERVKGVFNISVKVMVTAAALMGIIFGGLLTQPKIYADVLDVIRSIFSTHDSYEYQSGNTTENLDFNKSISPRYIPQGFTIRFVYYADSDVSVTYDNADGEEIKLSYGSSYDSKISIDNERSQLFEFERNEITYYYYKALEEDKFSTMLWYKNNYYFVITAQISEEEFVKIAENIEFMQ